MEAVWKRKVWSCVIEGSGYGSISWAHSWARPVRRGVFLSFVSSLSIFKEQTTVWDYLTTVTKTKSTSSATTTTTTKTIQLILVIYCHILACQPQRNNQFQIQHYDTSFNTYKYIYKHTKSHKNTEKSIHVSNHSKFNYNLTQRFIR